jgi:ribosomal protein S27E
MPSAPLSCPKCKAELPAEFFQPGVAQPCRSCGRQIEGVIFPAFHRAPAAHKPAEAVMTAEDAACFYHPQSRAVVPCDMCGRFLCALCDVELHGQHICPACVAAGRKKRQTLKLENERVLYGQVALTLSVLPLLVWPLTAVTGPAAVFVAIYGWNKPPSLTGGGKARHVLAVLFGLAEMGGWTFLLLRIFKLV